MRVKGLFINHVNIARVRAEGGGLVKISKIVYKRESKCPKTVHMVYGWPPRSVILSQFIMFYTLNECPKVSSWVNEVLTLQFKGKI